MADQAPIDPARAALLQRVRDDHSYHPPTPEARSLHDQVTARCLGLSEWMALTLPLDPHLSMALRDLENARTHANAAVAIALSPLRQ